MAKLKETKEDKYVFEVTELVEKEVEYTSEELDEKIALVTENIDKFKKRLDELNQILEEHQALKDLIK